MSPAQTIRRLSTNHPLNDSSAEDPGTAHLRSITGAEFDELVERVADRLEQRVVDELARRGRHRVPEVF